MRNGHRGDRHVGLEPHGEQRRQQTADAEADDGGRRTGEDGEQEKSEMEEDAPILPVLRPGRTCSIPSCAS
jgi:hypothetical protein